MSVINSVAKTALPAPMMVIFMMLLEGKIED
jgi:hypothetical protein